MVQLFERRGMSREDAEEAIKRMAKYPAFFVNLMMREELSLPVPGEDDGVLDSFRDGVVMFCSFAVFGMIPIAGFAVVPLLLPGLTDRQLFALACAFTALALVSLGAFKARFHDKYDYWQYLRSGLETLVLGGACAAVAFIVGRTVSSFAEDTLNMRELYVST